MERSGKISAVVAASLILNLLAGFVGVTQAEEEPSPFLHPLLDVQLVNGKVPGLEVKDSFNGGRYVIVDSVFVNGSGNEIRFSGVKEVQRYSPDSEELAEMELDKPARDPSDPAADPSGGTPTEITPKIGDELTAALAVASPRETLPVLIRLQRPSELPLFLELERWIGLGLIRSQDDMDAARQTILADRRVAIRALQESVVQRIDEAGDRVDYRCINMPCLDASLTPGTIAALATLPDVVRMDLDIPATQEAAISGEEVIAATQIQQFIDAGYDGELGLDPEVTMAIIDSGFMDDHFGFAESGANSALRFRGRFECNLLGCNSILDFNSADPDHGTLVTGIALGDLRDDQDPWEVTESDQIRRSGYAGEARAYLYESSSSGRTRRALDDVIGRAHQAHAVNLSQGYLDDDLKCRGTSALNRDVNDLFENGHVLVKSAGNEGHANATDCTVTSPGSAIGAFTVGGHGTFWSVSDAAADLNTGPIYLDTSLGGASWDEGRWRSIVDVVAPAHRTLLFDAGSGYGTSASGTSLAAPTVTAGATNFVDFYKHEFGNNIDNPGILYANLLLMGDRQGQSGKRKSGYDGLWGGGRLKMRKFDEEGMDSAWGWETGSLCVDDGETVVVPANNGWAIGSNVDDFKAVVWWYDQRHETGTTVDDIDLRLHTPQFVSPLVASLRRYDNKERIYTGSARMKPVELRIHGATVTADDTGCGTNSMRVYYAYFFEDDSRGDLEGPGPEIAKE